jgi:hypothetical protein
MNMRVGSIAAALLLAASGAAWTQDKEPLSKDAFDRLVEKLGSEEFEHREAAQRELEAYGKDILPSLKEAHGKAKDLERRTRLGEILRKLEAPPAPTPADRNRPPEQEFGGGVWRIERPDPKKQLEEMNKLVEQMKKLLENKDLSDEEKVREMTRLSSQLQAAALRSASGSVIRVQRVVRSGQQQPPQEPGGGGEKIPTQDPKPAPAPEKESKPKEY